jgi:3-phosphoshikimate 1-carboxyvinyltransferase
MAAVSSLRLGPPAPLNATIRPPGSKSLSNRDLLLAAMATGSTTIRGLLDAEDTRVMLDCLDRLGVHWRLEHEGQPLEAGVVVTGSGRRMGLVGGEPRLNVGTAGTVARFLTAALAASTAPTWSSVQVDGSARMRQRPMETLLDALSAMGASIESLGQPGALPCRIRATTGLAGGTATFDDVASSQFISALLIAGVWAKAPLRLLLRRGTPARPYVDMTITELARFGARAAWTSPGTGEAGQVLSVEPGELRAPLEALRVEPDASAASYLLALPVIWGGQVTVPDLGRASGQGDARFVDVLRSFGGTTEQSGETTRAGGGARLRGCDIDLADMPDMTLTAAVVALFAEGPTRLRGVGILRHHESDRLSAGATELRKLGATVHEHDDGLEIHPPARGPRAGVAIDTYKDHRMAMAFALVGDVEIRDPECAGKTYPRYWDVLRGLGMTPP